MRIDLPAGELLVELLLKFGIEEVLHAFRGFVEVVGVKDSFWPTCVRLRLSTVLFFTRKPTEMPVPSCV